MRETGYINDISGVVPGGNATAKFPLGRRYHDMKVYVEALIEGDPDGAPGVFDTVTNDVTKVLESVKLMVNTKTQRELDVANILKITETNFPGMSFTSHLPIFFSKPTRQNILAQEANAWPMFNGVFGFEGRFKLKPLSEIRNPVIRISATWDYSEGVTDAKGNVVLDIEKWTTQSLNAPAGEHNIPNIDFVNRKLQRIHFATTAGTISQVKVDADDRTRIEATKAELDDRYKDYGMVSPYELSLIFDHENQLTSPLMVGRMLNITPTFSDANNTLMIIESRQNAW